MNDLEATAIMERGAAALVGVEVGFPVVIKLGTKTHTFTVVGLYGREPGPGWEPQNPTLYIPVTYLEKIRTKYILLRRILVRFYTTTMVMDWRPFERITGSSCFLTPIAPTRTWYLAMTGGLALPKQRWLS